MNADPVKEVPIDSSSTYYLEERALAFALSKAATDGERAKVRHLMALREELMQRRAALLDELTARRQARGEYYSDAKVRAINAMTPTREELDLCAQASFGCQEDAGGVLKAHARTAFGMGYAMRRALLPPRTAEDAADPLRQMRKLEEAFAAEWMAAIAEPAFHTEISALRREDLAQSRTASCPMFLVSVPACPASDAIDAAALGRAWNRLDALSQSLGVQPLSDFIGIEGQSPSDSAPAADVLATVGALLSALQDGTHRVPAKKATRAALELVRDALRWLHARQGRAHFEVDL